MRHPWGQLLIAIKISYRGRKKQFNVRFFSSRSESLLLCKSLTERKTSKLHDEKNFVSWLMAEKPRQFDTSRVETGQFADKNVCGKSPQSNGCLKPTVFQQERWLAGFPLMQRNIWQRARQVALRLPSSATTFHLQWQVKNASSNTIITNLALTT